MVNIRLHDRTAEVLALSHDFGTLAITMIFCRIRANDVRCTLEDGILVNLNVREECERFSAMQVKCRSLGSLEFGPRGADLREHCWESQSGANCDGPDPSGTCECAADRQGGLAGPS